MQASVARTAAFGRVAPRVVPCPTVQTQEAVRDVCMMAKKKGVRLIVTVECTEAKKEGATPSRYCTQKNRKNTPDRLELMKYNPNLRRHTLHKEIK